MVFDGDEPVVLVEKVFRRSITSKRANPAEGSGEHGSPLRLPVTPENPTLAGGSRLR